MANTKSAKKQVRAQARKKSYNLKVKTAFRSTRKELKNSIAKGKTENSAETMKTLYKKLDKAAKNNAIHKNTAARYKSKAAKKLNKAASPKKK
jgi:small subunit ribosomal protein S20